MRRGHLSRCAHRVAAVAVRTGGPATCKLWAGIALRLVWAPIRRTRKRRGMPFRRFPPGAATKACHIGNFRGKPLLGLHGARPHRHRVAPTLVLERHPRARRSHRFRGKSRAGLRSTCRRRPRASARTVALTCAARCRWRTFCYHPFRGGIGNGGSDVDRRVPSRRAPRRTGAAPQVGGRHATWRLQVL